MAPLSTPFTELFGVKHPVLNAGMDTVAGPELVAAVSNAGGMGCFGGVNFMPKLFRSKLEEIKELLVDKDAPFAVDLALPQIGGNARKTNKDYTKGHLDELIDIILEFKPVLFMCAIGVPPPKVVERLHAANIMVGNMVGHPKHIKKALDAGVDIICAQGGEAGGHTGEIPFSILIPAAVKAVKGKKSPLNGKPIQVIAAGAIHSGASLAAALSYGATAVWVGTKFIASEEAGCSDGHRNAVLDADHEGLIKTTIFSGRPLRTRATPLVVDWEKNRQKEIQELTSKGIVPVGMDDEHIRPYLMGQVAAVIETIEPAGKIVEDMVNEAAEILARNAGYLSADVRAKL